MLRSLLRRPERDGAGKIDEGMLTKSVISSYASHEGAGGHEAAAMVRPARLALWRAMEEHEPGILAAGLRERGETGDPSNRGGVGSLRKAMAEWLSPVPKCWDCRLPMVAGRRCRGGQKACRVSRAAHDNTRTLLPPLLHREVAGALEGVRTAAKIKAKAEAPLEILVDRDLKILLAQAERSSHPEVTKAAEHLEKCLSDAILANGRLILKVQLQFYSPAGAVTRADLIQGGALGCRRGLLDFDPSQAKFSAYAIQWIRRGLLDVFSSRDLVGSPDEIATRRRRLDYLGLDAKALLSGLLDAGAGHFRGLMEALEPVLTGERILHEIHLARVVLQAKKLTEERRILKVAGWAAKRIDEGHARKMSRTGPQKVKTGGRRKAAPMKRAPMGGAALLSALRNGGTQVVSLDREDRDAGDETAQGQAMLESGGTWQGGQWDHPLLVSEDAEARSMELEEEAREHDQFLLALSELRMENPEAAEVVRRNHGLDGVVAESLENISKAPLRCSGRKVSRETLRHLGELGLSRMRLFLQAQGIGWENPAMKAEVSDGGVTTKPASYDYKPSLSGVTMTPTELDAWTTAREELASISW